jgi:type IV pilus assembly protein PilE
MERFMNPYRAFLTASRRRCAHRSAGAFPTLSPAASAYATGTRAGASGQSGFTLIELLVVVGIVAILAAVALASYADYVKRGKVTEVASALGDGRVKMEQYFLDKLTYIGGPCGASTKYFTVACSPAPTATTYTVTATGVSDMANFVYTVNQLNAKTTQGPWVSGTQPCWILKKGDTC